MPRPVTLVPNTGIQFWDIDLDLERLPRLSRYFWEEAVAPAPDDTGSVPVVLRELREEDGALTDPVSGQIPSADEIYSVGRSQAVELALNRFVPLPYFQLRARGHGGQAVYARGPTNWVRGRLTEHPSPAQGRSHCLTLVFDTTLARQESAGPYVALDHTDSEQQREFLFVADTEANSWFLDEVWVSEWLQEMFIELRREQRGGRPFRPEDEPHACEHYARYIVFLALLESSGLLPRIRLLDVVSRDLGYAPVMVDLVLDIGNSRTCGILIEEHPGQGINLSDSYPLALRDLSRPELVHGKPFSSRVEFTRASFGRDAIARRAGRANSFA
ncbi:MAG: virulence factor SrfB, partial [Alphaproteobacteria bacterium]|nr:virulence factor SrfB [Alphaproteobacteria bacterium]